MSYESLTENAMILPLPVARPLTPESFRFIDLQEAPTLFRDLSNGFPYYPPLLSIGCAASKSAMDASRLEVSKIGNYIASFVPTLQDMERLDPRFTFPSHIWQKLDRYADFSFAVFQLASGELFPHPMGMEFAKEDSSIFFPTLHVHDGELHDEEEFDHILYLQHAGFDSRVSRYLNSDVADPATGWIRSISAANEFIDSKPAKQLMAPELLVHRKAMEGNYKNEDIVVRISGDPEVPSINFRRLLQYAPWLVAAGLFSWFLVRRNRVRRAELAALKRED